MRRLFVGLMLFAILGPGGVSPASASCYERTTTQKATVSFGSMQIVIEDSSYRDLCGLGKSEHLTHVLEIKRSRNVACRTSYFESEWDALWRRVEVHTTQYAPCVLNLVVTADPMTIDLGGSGLVPTVHTDPLVLGLAVDGVYSMEGTALGGYTLGGLPPVVIPDDAAATLTTGVLLGLGA